MQQRKCIKPIKMHDVHKDLKYGCMKLCDFVLTSPVKRTQKCFVTWPSKVVQLAAWHQVVRFQFGRAETVKQERLKGCKSIAYYGFFLITWGCFLILLNAANSQGISSVTTIIQMDKVLSESHSFHAAKFSPESLFVIPVCFWSAKIQTPKV